MPVLPEAAPFEGAAIVATGEGPAGGSTAVANPQLTEESVPPRPSKPSESSTEEQKSSYQELMQQRRRITERLRQQQRVRGKRDRSKRTRPSKEEETARRALQRAHTASASALSAVVTAKLPIHHDTQHALHTAISQAERKLEGCAPALPQPIVI